MAYIVDWTAYMFDQKIQNRIFINKEIPTIFIS